MDVARIMLTDRRSRSGQASSPARRPQPHEQPAEEHVAMLAASDLVAAQPDRITDRTAERRREARMRRLAKVPIPLDQRIVQGPLREPKAANTLFGAKIGNARMSRDLIHDYLTARSRLECSPTARSLVMQMEDGRTDAGRPINLKLVRARPSLFRRIHASWQKHDPGTARGRTAAAASQFGTDACLLAPFNFTSRRLPVEVRWDPRDAMITASGKIVSPALSLAHEFTHALHLRDGSFRFIRAGLKRIGQYTNVEELRTIRIERIMARELGEGVRQAHCEGVPVLAHSVHGDHTAYPLAVNDANIGVITRLPQSHAIGEMLDVRQEIFCADGRQPLGPAPRLRNPDGTKRTLPPEELIAFTLADGTRTVNIADRMYRNVPTMPLSERIEFARKTGICACPKCTHISEVRSLPPSDGGSPV